MNKCTSCGSVAIEADSFCRNCGAVLPQPVPRDVQIGKTLVIVSAIINFVITITMSLYSLTIASLASASVNTDCINDLITGSIEIVLFYFIFRGYSWARWLMGLFALFGTCYGLVFLQQVNSVMFLILLFGTGSIAAILLLSPKVRAFQQAQIKARLDK